MTPRVRIPADVERSDPIVAGLTARQLVVLSAGGMLLVGGDGVLGRLVPLPVLVSAGLAVAAVVVMLTFGERDGLSADRFALAALRYWRAARRLVLAPEGLPTGGGQRGVGPLRVPLRAVADDGVIELDGGAGLALICRASPVNFALRSEAEQAGLVAAFAGFLHGLPAVGGSVQFVLRTQRADPEGHVASLLEAAGGLAHPDLEAAARAHGEFLAALAANHDAVHREILVVFRESAAGAAALDRRVEEAAGLLAAADVRLTPLTGVEAMTLLRRTADPEARALPDGGAAYGAIIRRAER